MTLNEVECSFFKPPQRLQACAKNSPNMEGVVCKTTNFNQKYAELDDNSVFVLISCALILVQQVAFYVWDGFLKVVTDFLPWFADSVIFYVILAL
jgi:hypothetical protein